MQTSFRAGLAAVLALLFLVGPCHAADDPVVAQRGADRLTLSQARAIVGALDPDARHRLDGTPAVAELLRNVLLQRAILQQALAQKWDRRPDVAVLAQHARDVAVGQSFLAAQAPVPPGYPAESDIAAAYEQNKPRLLQPRGYHLSQVFIAATSAQTDAARLALSGVAQQAAAHPRGGLQEAASHVHNAVYADLGWLADTQIVPAIKATVSGLQEGATSDPVCTANGCHLIRLIATRPAGPAPIETVRDALIRALRQAKQSSVEQAYANTLLARQPVQVNEIELPQVTAP